jgi:hypothetical protein
LLGAINHELGGVGKTITVLDQQRYAQFGQLLADAVNAAQDEGNTPRRHVMFLPLAMVDQENTGNAAALAGRVQRGVVAYTQIVA